MKKVPSYPKILTLGSSYTDNAIKGEVIIQEKVDGSLFAFGKNEDGELVIRSKGTQIYYQEGTKTMFQKAIDYVLSIKDKILSFPQETYFYCEFLAKPKHNVLKYKNTPKNNLVLFDCLLGGKWEEEHFSILAEELEIDLIPELYRGKVDVEKIKSLLETKSYLGGEIIEGVVIKNYTQTILLGGHVFPLFTKYVREKFKERHKTEWKVKSPKGSLQDYIAGFKSEARWQKAFQYLRDNGKLENQPRDIGKLFKRVNEDIIEEEAENIKNELYKKFIKDILRKSTQGLAEWYKNKLLESLEEK